MASGGGRTVASSVKEGLQTADLWLNVAEEPHTDEKHHVPIKRLKVCGPKVIDPLSQHLIRCTRVRRTS